MSTNLRLSEGLAGALREEAARRGTSQQEMVPEAIAKELGMASELTRSSVPSEREPSRRPCPSDIEPTAGSRALLINMHSLPH